MAGEVEKTNLARQIFGCLISSHAHAGRNDERHDQTAARGTDFVYKIRLSTCWQHQTRYWRGSGYHTIGQAFQSPEVEKERHSTWSFCPRAGIVCVCVRETEKGKKEKERLDGDLYDFVHTELSDGHQSDVLETL